MDDFLELLLKMLSLVFCVDKEYRKNIKDFSAKYVFLSNDGRIAVSAIFKKGKMAVKRRAIKDTDVNITIKFKDGKALWEFLFSGNPDIIEFVLENKLSYDGNLNYALKFAYLAVHLLEYLEEKLGLEKWIKKTP